MKYNVYLSLQDGAENDMIFFEFLIFFNLFHGLSGG